MSASPALASTSQTSASNAWPIESFGGAGPVLHFAVGNGFPPRSYRALLATLASRFQVVAAVPRPMWSEPGPLSALASWDGMAQDMGETLRHHQLKPVIAAGHSMGAIASILLALRTSAQVRALVLLDPTVLSPWALRCIAALRAISPRFEHLSPLSRAALRRRSTFASAEEAFVTWRKKAFFGDWPDAALYDYAASATRSRDGATGVELSWPPAWEAQGFRAIYTQTCKRMAELPRELPVLVLRGETSNAFSLASLRRMQRAFPPLRVGTIRGHGHSFPHTAPAEGAKRVLEFLAQTQAYR